MTEEAKKSHRDIRDAFLGVKAPGAALVEAAAALERAAAGVGVAGLLGLVALRGAEVLLREVVHAQLLGLADLRRVDVREQFVVEFLVDLLALGLGLGLLLDLWVVVLDAHLVVIG